MRSRQIRRWGAALGWVALLLWLGSRPPDELPVTDWWLARFDKAIHAAMYGVAGLLAAWAWRGHGVRAVMLGALWGLCWGGLDEWVQGRVPGRFADGWDLAADVAGAAAGAWIAGRWNRTRSREDRSPH